MRSGELWNSTCTVLRRYSTCNFLNDGKNTTVADVQDAVALSLRRSTVPVSTTGSCRYDGMPGRHSVMRT